MAKYRLIVVVILALIVIGITGCAAQSSPTPVPPQPTPLQSSSAPPTPPAPSVPATQTVSTAGQLANDGAAVFSQDCAKCHGLNGVGGGSPALTGSAARLSRYNNARQLLDFISAQMPLGKGGSLSSQDYLRVLAFLLVQDGYVQATAPLDPAMLSAIQLTK